MGDTNGLNINCTNALDDKIVPIWPFSVSKLVSICLRMAIERPSMAKLE